MKITKIDQITSIILLFLGILFYSITKNYPSGAAAFPRAICIIIIVLAVLLFLSSLNPKFSVKIKKEENKFIFWQFASIAVMTIFYIYFIILLGYFMITPIYIFCSMFVLRVRNSKLLIMVPLFSTILLFLTFRTFLNVPLP